MNALSGTAVLLPGFHRSGSDKREEGERKPSRESDYNVPLNEGEVVFETNLAGALLPRAGGRAGVEVVVMDRGLSCCVGCRFEAE